MQLCVLVKSYLTQAASVAATGRPASPRARAADYAKGVRTKFRYGVSRLAANLPFTRHNLCPLSFIDVPQQAYVDAMIGGYELNRIELLRDVFVWAYECSCQQYVAVQKNLVPPDIFRLRYRQALREVVAAVVQNDQAAIQASVLAKMPSTVIAADKDHFVKLVLEEFAALHTGNAVRFGIRPLELAAWMQQHGSAAETLADQLNSHLFKTARSSGLIRRHGEID